MATNVSGIAIVIKAFLPTGKTLDEQFAALSLVKDAHESGDYSPLLAAANIDEVKTEQKVRRVEDVPAAAPEATETTGAESGDDLPDDYPEFDAGIDEPRVNPEDEPEDEPEFAEVEQDNAPAEREPDEPAPAKRRMAR